MTKNFRSGSRMRNVSGRMNLGSERSAFPGMVSQPP